MTQTLPTTHFFRVVMLVAVASLVGILGVSFASPLLAQAQSSQDLGSSGNELVMTAIPPRTETITVKPGETFQTSVQLRNVSSQSQSITTDVQDFIVGQDGKTPTAISRSESAPLRWSLASWIIVSPTERVLGPNELGQYDVVIQVPKDALPGGHYAMILHYPTPLSGKTKGANAKAPTSASEISPRVGTLVYVRVAGDVHEEALIRSFTVPQWVEFGPVNMRYAVENLSDIHITPQSSIVIKNMFGKTVTTIASEALNIFPSTMREFTATFDQIWGFGPYSAHLTVPYGETGKMVTATATFWMFPHRLVLAVLVILMSMLAISIVVRRHFMHRSDVKTKQIEMLEDRIKELEQRVQN